ncbi:ABC transporter substrate-binding protein [Anaerobium acetethylicum]|uniref:Putative aldouronate transport system substrate-binding protein n=1 Tax=Anaerobium acetethylicum TaxID=1619234 RepID=A0A1D3TNG3_9FIRM|nr:ABC transporter substrate-binding protein [Anaerobium acetethylicum]SCP94849.1 putative aldouronate transport system substrate-binding protein [Anaerobium acetethylicum]
MKKNFLKKVLGVALSMTLVAGTLTGCGSGQETKETQEKTETEGGAGALDTSEEVELVMYVVSDRPAGQDAVDENLNKLLKEKLNCTLKINWIGWAEYSNKYPLLYSSGEAFDMAYSATWLNFASLANKGAFKSLDELWPAYAPKNFEKATDAAKMQATIDGHYYCVPTLLSTYNNYGLIYRTDIMEGTDWDGKMETFEDVEKYCDIVKATHPEMEPLDISASGPEWQNVFMFDQGMSYVTKGLNSLLYDPAEEKPQVKAVYDVEGLKGFLEMMTRWNEKGYFSKSALSDTDSGKTANGKAAIKIHNIDSYRDISAQHPEYKFAFSNFVKDIAHLPYTQDCMVISNTSKNPERALAFWDLVTSDQEVYNAFFYGIEGTSYELNDKGQFSITDPDLYTTSAMWAARTDGLNLEQVGTPDDYQTSIDQYESQIVDGKGNEKYTGFVFDTTAVETEVATCNNIYQQYFYPLVLGYTDIDSGLEEFEKQMKVAGIEKIQEEAQRQLDEYIAGLE